MTSAYHQRRVGQDATPHNHADIPLAWEVFGNCPACLVAAGWRLVDTGAAMDGYPDDWPWSRPAIYGMRVGGRLFVVRSETTRRHNHDRLYPPWEVFVECPRCVFDAAHALHALERHQ